MADKIISEYERGLAKAVSDFSEEEVRKFFNKNRSILGDDGIKYINSLDDCGFRRLMAIISVNLKNVPQRTKIKAQRLLRVELGG